MSGERLITVTEHADGAIAELNLNRPDKRNALSQELVDDLLGAVKTIAADSRVRAVVLGGEGKSFCAGMDLKAVQTEPAKMGALLLNLSYVYREIRRSPQPYIARVRGAAIGGGCGLMCVCDFAFTHADAKVGYPEVDLGICPAAVAPWLMRRIGAGRARQLLLAGGILTGEEGYEIGMVSHLADLDDLRSAALSFGQDLAKGGPEAVATTKAWLNELDGSMQDDLLDKGARLSAEIVQGNEAQERLAAFFARQ
jgi:methylglutaconyl-CoA hydratase